ncbi:MAG TPA: MBL fold metallo-hydrolase [Bryobacteraceae bacterium]|jgi:phosphoribosyl 1,2-cyclic phosphodiesterase|nr:MBL fold metallo-hydrolase [Bryobacteraceae bacterium]
MRLRFWGTRGSIAVPGPGTNHFGGNTTCVELTTPTGGIFVLDCGTGARLLGDQLLAVNSGPVSAAILLTHTHWDHIQGFPFFAPLFVPRNRFVIYGPEGTQRSLRDVLAGQMEHDYFPVALSQLAAEISFRDLTAGAYEIDGLHVRTQEMHHTARTLGYRIESNGHSICYLGDHEPYYDGIWHEGAVPGRMESIREERDRRHAEFMQGADIAIHDAQYTPEEYVTRRSWGHSAYPYVVELAALAGVRRLFLTHHDPTHDDAFVREIETRARAVAKQLKSPLEVTCAYEGCEIAL